MAYQTDFVSLGVPVHVNPAFFAQGPPPGFSTGGTGHLQAAISEVEFEEIMRRNKTVSSTAIARAVEVNFKLVNLFWWSERRSP